MAGFFFALIFQTEFNQDTRQEDSAIEIIGTFLSTYTWNVRLTWPMKYPTGWLIPPLPST